MTLVKYACDYCRVRRVKCDGKKPCSRCIQHDFECTYQQPLKKRGPKRFGARNLKYITEAQKFKDNNDSCTTTAEISMKVPKKLIDQCLRLYHDNLYVIWPLLSYNELHKLLDEKYDDRYVYWFLVALSAATLSDLQTELESENGFSFTGKKLSILCISSRQQFDDLSGRDIFRIMTYYCLVRCFSQYSDIRNSYRLCCEAVGLITVSGLHREKSYESFSFCEQQLLRKVYYLLLLTERYYSVYVHRVTSLDDTVSPPQSEFVTDPRLSLDSFFEMIRVFTVPGKCFFDALATEAANTSCTEDSLKKIWKELHTASLEIEPWSYGYVDISFSRHWIRALAWKLVFQMNGTKFFSNANNAHILVEIARDMIDDIFLTPKNLYVVHGPTIPMKALEIANALVDVINQHDKNTELEAWNVLCEVSNFVCSLKHYDGSLIESFVAKCQNSLISLPLFKFLGSSDNLKDGLDVDS